MRNKSNYLSYYYTVITLFFINKMYFFLLLFNTLFKNVFTNKIIVFKLV